MKTGNHINTQLLEERVRFRESLYAAARDRLDRHQASKDAEATDTLTPQDMRLISMGLKALDELVVIEREANDEAKTRIHHEGHREHEGREKTEPRTQDSNRRNKNEPTDSQVDTTSIELALRENDKRGSNNTTFPPDSTKGSQISSLRDLRDSASLDASERLDGRSPYLDQRGEPLESEVPETLPDPTAGMNRSQRRKYQQELERAAKHARKGHRSSRYG